MKTHCRFSARKAKLQIKTVVYKFMPVAGYYIFINQKNSKNELFQLPEVFPNKVQYNFKILLNREC